jgi:ABC-type sugar transport system ATPase subunit
MASIVLEKITKRFGRVTALAEVDLSVRSGEFFVVLGPSGAGKSTLINLISGIERPDAGRVRLGERDVTDAFPQQRNIATAFESYALYPHFTVYRNLAFPLEAPRRRREQTPAQRDARVRAVATLLGLEDLLARYPRELSGGQKQRVALGRTLVRQPQAYLLDEPIAHLDAKLRHRMRSELKKIQQELGITTLYCTPDQLEALSMGDTIAVLSHGRVEQVGTPDDLYYRPRNLFVAAFVGDPPMNVFPIEWQGDRAQVLSETPYALPIRPEDRQRLEARPDAGAVKLGVRPKDIRLTRPDDPAAHTAGQVALIDTLGQTSIITLKLQSEEIQVKASSDDLPKVGDRAGLVMDNSRFYYFEADTGLSLG